METETRLHEMDYFKINLETGKKQSEERILYVQATSIIGALDISKKIRGATMKSIFPINEETYFAGVDKKYDKHLSS